MESVFVAVLADLCLTVTIAAPLCTVVFPLVLFITIATIHSVRAADEGIRLQAQGGARVTADNAGRTREVHLRGTIVIEIHRHEERAEETAGGEREAC